jgi:hypothetical protein
VALLQQWFDEAEEEFLQALAEHLRPALAEMRQRAARNVFLEDGTANRKRQQQLQEEINALYLSIQLFRCAHFCFIISKLIEMVCDCEQTVSGDAGTAVGGIGGDRAASAADALRRSLPRAAARLELVPVPRGSIPATRIYGILQWANFFLMAWVCRWSR